MKKEVKIVIKKCPRCSYIGYQDKWCKNCGERLKEKK